MSHKDVSGNQVDRAAEIIHAGGLVAFPTETYYGIGVDPFNEVALQRLFEIKKRPTLKPVLVLIEERSQIDLLVTEIPESAFRLMDTFWPGPLTMVLPARPELSKLLTGGTATVGVRLSPNPFAQALLRSCRIPLTATSANYTGGNAAATPEEVWSTFGSTLNMIIQGGKTPGKKGSTLVGFKQGQVYCIREGCLSYKEIVDSLSR